MPLHRVLTIHNKTGSQNPHTRASLVINTDDIIDPAFRNKLRDWKATRLVNGSWWLVSFLKRIKHGVAIKMITPINGVYNSDMRYPVLINKNKYVLCSLTVNLSIISFEQRSIPVSRKTCYWGYFRGILIRSVIVVYQHLSEHAKFLALVISRNRW